MEMAGDTTGLYDRPGVVYELAGVCDGEIKTKEILPQGSAGNIQHSMFNIQVEYNSIRLGFFYKKRPNAV